MDDKVKKVLTYAKKIGLYNRDSWEELISMASEGNERICGPRELFNNHLKIHGARRTEAFFVFTLTGDHRVNNLHIVTMGTVNRTIVHPREVFYEAIKDNATAIIVAHNHPSGNLEPSPDDLEITRRLERAGDILGIPVLDHIVFSKNSYSSLVESGVMEMKT